MTRLALAFFVAWLAIVAAPEAARKAAHDVAEARQVAR
jgi:hypothetical protein